MRNDYLDERRLQNGGALAEHGANGLHLASSSRRASACVCISFLRHSPLTPSLLQSPKFSGLANRATLDISSHPSGRGFTIAYREPKTSPYAVKSGIETKELKGGKKEAKKEIVKLLDSLGRPELYQVRPLASCFLVGCSSM